MHTSVMAFIEQCVNEYELAGKKTLEVGSMDVNGSPRQFFTGSYYGVDMRPGYGVDRILNAHELWALDDKYEVVISTEMLEHDSEPWTSVRQMRLRCSDAGGFLILTARGYDERGCFPIHSYPDDLWRFSVHGATELLKWAGWTPLKVEQDPQDPGFLAVAKV